MAEPNVVSTHSLHIPPRKGVDEPPIICNVSIRTGATPELIVHTLDHFRQAVIALWHGFRPADEIWGKRSTCGIENTTGEALVLIWSNEVFMLLPNGKRKKVSINKFHEKTTALECVMQMEMSQNAINDFHKLVLEVYEREAAQVGEQPATLQPTIDPRDAGLKRNVHDVLPLRDEWNGTYPVPTIVERTMTRQRHNPFVPTQEQKMRQAMEDIEYSDYQGDDIHEYAD